MNHSLSILFYLRKSKANKNGQVPIYLRITVDGNRAEVSINRSIEKERWNATAQCAKGNKEETRSLNEYLAQTKSKIHHHFNVLSSGSTPITAELLKNAFQGITAKRHSIIEVIEYHNRQMKDKIGIDFAVGTSKRYEVTFRKIQAFLKHQFNCSDIFLSEINFSFVSEFDHYLKTVELCQHNTAMKYIKNLKKIIRLALANEWIEKDPFLNFKCTSKETNRSYLTQEELDRLMNKEFSIERLGIVRDIFIFSCFTGLAYSDVEKLKPSDVVTGIDGKKWITIFREKTEGRSSIPLLPVALAIIEKYSNYPENAVTGKLLPVKSNQKMNAYLKEIADCCTLTKLLTFHVARHTFATTITLTNGVPIETVSSMLGHRSIRTTQIYSKVIDRKISTDMDILEIKLSGIDQTKKLRIG